VFLYHLGENRLEIYQYGVETEKSVPKKIKSIFAVSIYESCEGSGTKLGVDNTLFYKYEVNYFIN